MSTAYSSEPLQQQVTSQRVLLGVLACLAVAVLGLLLLLFTQVIGRPPPQGSRPPLADQQRDQDRSNRPPSAALPAERSTSAPATAVSPQVSSVQKSIRGPLPMASATQPGFSERVVELSQVITPLSSVESLVEPASATVGAVPAEQETPASTAVRSTGPAPDPAFWNYWLTRPNRAGDVPAPGGVPSPYVGELALQTLHRLNLRLSTMDLAVVPQVATLQPSAALTSTVESALQEGSKKQLELDVFITPSDEQRLLIPKSERQPSILIDLDRLRAAQSKPSASSVVQNLQGLIREAALAQFGFDFRVLVPGMHQVAISIVDAATAVPVQSMVVSLTTSAQWPQSVSIDSSPQGFMGADRSQVDLSLILEALQGDTDSGTYAQLTAKLFYRNSSWDPAAAERPYKVIKWTSAQDLEALKTSAGNFSSIVGDSQNAEALRDLGRDLARPLFDPELLNLPQKFAEENADRARVARQVIVDLAKDPKNTLPPTMLVLIVKQGSQSRYSSQVLPIGALGVSKADEPPVFLGERFSLALRFTDSDLSPSYPCPRDWYVALPTKVTADADSALSAALAGLSPVQQRWKDHIHPQSSTLEELGGWLSKPEAGSAKKAFVLTYVGHHRNGSLSLGADAAQSITVGTMRRDFQGSSIVILNACNSAMGEINSGMPIGMLAQQRAAAIIATTSPIKGALAANYLNCMSAVLANRPDDLTIGQAHALTTRCLWSKKEGGMYDYSGAALKYLLVGNPFQRICAPASAASSATPQVEAANGNDQL